MPPSPPRCSLQRRLQQLRCSGRDRLLPVAHLDQLPQELRTLPRSHPGSLKHLLQPVQQLRRPLQLRNIRRQVQEGLRQMLKKILLYQEEEDKDKDNTEM